MPKFHSKSQNAKMKRKMDKQLKYLNKNCEQIYMKQYINIYTKNTT